MTPEQKYQSLLTNGTLMENAEQRDIVAKLDNIHIQLIERQRVRDSGLGKVRRKIKPRAPIQGLYLWGSVGVGKTFLMDLFYDCTPVKKMRMHFHQFMEQIQIDLTKRQGEKDPLAAIAKTIADKHVLLCFDEFFVNDIADAMILGQLFNALFKGGVCLIASSNIAPDNLYQNGLQRERFLPTITLLKKYCDVVHLTTQQDYRLHHIDKAGVFYTPLDQAANKNMERAFALFAENHPVSTTPIKILGRDIAIVKQAHTVIWFEFSALCSVPRSQRDYLELAKHYRTVLISNVRPITHKEDALITAFIHLIDVFYDARIRVIISSETRVEDMYTQGRMLKPFRRTQSRLIDMQSVAYCEPGTDETALL